MLRLLTFLSLCLLTVLGCKSDFKYQYLENPYSNPVVQQDYAEWLHQQQMRQLAARVQLTVDELNKLYEAFMAEYTTRQKHTADALEKERLARVIAFCRAAYSCPEFLENIDNVR